jgi:hypothetical protein
VPAVRRLIVVPLLALTALNPAQAATTGTIEGRIVYGHTDEPVAGVKVTLVGRNSDGTDPITDSAETGPDGSYRFTDLKTGDDRLYTLDAIHDGGTFAGGAVSLPSDTGESPVIETTLRVWDTTTDSTVILIERDDLFVVPQESEVAVIESVTIANTSEFAYIGRGASRNEAAATIGFALPAGTSGAGVLIRDSTIDIPEIQPTEYGFAASVAIPPGETQVTFLYALEGSGGSFDLSKRALYPTLETSVFTVDPFVIESNRLALDPDGEVTLEGETYTRFRTDAAVDAGDPIQIVAVAQADLSPMTLVGVIAAGATVIAAIALLLRRRKVPRSAAPVPTEIPDDLVAAIAELDMRYLRGEVSQVDWSNERAALKARFSERVEAR